MYSSFGEIDAIISQIDLSKPEGRKIRAILEAMYSCGLRVTETVNLKNITIVFGCWLHPGNW